jgi:serine/threonine-protein kinase
VRQALEGLAAAHALGIVHRDLKPANLLVDAAGRLKIADFGISKLRDGHGRSALTQTRAFVGTPAYMAPEQFEDQPTTIAVDLYALGAILYELLTGHTPFPAKDTISTIRAIREDPAPSLPPDLPPALGDIVGRLLRKDPAERYARAATLAADLEALTARLEAEHVPDDPMPQ